MPGGTATLSEPFLEVVAVILVENGKVLLARRNRGSLHGFWEFPGGKIRPAESHAQAAVREIQEELNLTIEPVGKLLEIEHEYPEKKVRLHFFLAKTHSDAAPQITTEQSHLEFAWFLPAELPLAECCPADRRAAALLPWSDILHN